MTTGRQIPLSFDARPAQGREDFLVADCNRRAVDALGRAEDWPARRLALIGPPRSGKSHLAALWTGERGGVRVDLGTLPAAEIEALAAAPVALDVPDVPLPREETPLLHLLNRLAERDQPCLLTAREAPGRWPVALPDLASRLAAIAVVRIDPPDDRVLGALLVKLAADRQMRLPPAVLDYVLRRIERSFATAEAVVAELDRASLSAKRPVSLALAAEVLDRPAPF
ncbi:MAG: chromosomal replication initiator DnaA [Paracoccaceae bacterium]